MLWLCLHFPHLAVELRQPPDEGCVAITDHHGSRRWLLACNAASRATGLHAQLDAAAALTRVPELQLIPRSIKQERAALNALAAWAQQFSSVVCIDNERWLIWMEIGASLRYFGGMQALLKKVAGEVASLHYTVVPGVAATLEAAALLTRPHANKAHIKVIARRSELTAGLSKLALETLATSPETIAALRSIGWQCIGDVLMLPRDALARRFGPKFTDYLRCLLGEQADPRAPYRVPSTYQRRFEMPAPLEAIEALLFPLRRMLGELQGYLRARDTALQELLVRFEHEQAPTTELTLRTTAPQRDATRLLALLRDLLERTNLPAPVVEIVITANRFVPLGDTQLDLFDDNKRRDMTWANLLDKLRARLGEQAVRRLGLHDDHRPEQAWCVLDEATSAATEQRLLDTYPQRPLWLIEPKPLTQLPNLIGKPERIEAGWWSGADVHRDYYVAETTEGSRWWVYRDVTTLQWYLHGLWA